MGGRLRLEDMVWDRRTCFEGGIYRVGAILNLAILENLHAVGELLAYNGEIDLSVCPMDPSG